MQHHFAEPDDTVIGAPRSGTTARAKLYRSPTETLVTRRVASAEAVPVAWESDQLFRVSCQFHVHELSTLFASLAAGASWSVRLAFPLHSSSNGWSVPTHVVLQQHQPSTKRFSKTQLAIPTQRHVPACDSFAPLLRQCHATFIGKPEANCCFRVPFIEAYGMTEASPSPSNRLSGRKVGSVGRAAGPDVAILDEATIESDGETGEIVIRGTSLMKDYDERSRGQSQRFCSWFRLRHWLGHGRLPFRHWPKRSSIAAARRSSPRSG